MAFKITNKEFAIVRALSAVDGACGEYMKTAETVDKTKEFFQSLTWLDDSLRGFYIGFDQNQEGYILEWRGTVRGSNEQFQRTVRIMTYTGTGMLFNTVEVMLKAIKKFKQETEEWVVK